MLRSKWSPIIDISQQITQLFDERREKNKMFKFSMSLKLDDIKLT